jgi:hypothetical protein
MNEIAEAAKYLHGLQIPPVGVVVALALFAAYVEQRMARKRTPDFSAAYRDLPNHPPAPPRD